MRRNWWIWAALAVLVLAIAGYNLFGYWAYSGSWGRGFYGPMGGMMYWMHGPGGIMGGLGYGFWSPLWTLLIIGLVILVVYLLLGNRGGPRHRYYSDHDYVHDLRCPNCGRPTEPGWQVCPYCRQPLDGTPSGGAVGGGTPTGNPRPAGQAPEGRGETR